MAIMHIDANSAYLSWTAVKMLAEGSGMDIRDVPSVIAGDPKNRHGIILAKSIPAKKFGIRTGESLLRPEESALSFSCFRMIFPFTCPSAMRCIV